MNEARLSPLERFLRIFTDVRAGEGPTALVLFANVFLVLCAYYLVKPLLLVMPLAEQITRRYGVFTLIARKAGRQRQ